jgi:heterogeneous nuclear ribonucleoprotein A1/A3
VCVWLVWLEWLIACRGFQFASVADDIRDLASKDPAHRKLFVRGLAWETSSQALRDAFEQFGEIEEGAVITDKGTGKSRGFGFITFKHMDSAQRALREPSKNIDVSFTVNAEFSLL